MSYYQKYIKYKLKYNMLKNKLFKGGNILEYYDENNNRINHNQLEAHEQYLAKKYIKPQDIVLELGASYGTVSCTVNQILENKTNQVVVEPDDRVWNALEQNKIRNNCNFHIVKGIISTKKKSLANKDVYYNGYGAITVDDPNSSIVSYTLKEVEEKYNLRFNVLIADCEGCMEEFFDENYQLYTQLRIIIFEADYPERCNYSKIKENLKNNNFKEVESGHQNVWLKN